MSGLRLPKNLAKLSNMELSSVSFTLFIFIDIYVYIISSFHYSSINHILLQHFTYRSLGLLRKLKHFSLNYQHMSLFEAVISWQSRMYVYSSLTLYSDGLVPSEIVCSGLWGGSWKSLKDKTKYHKISMLGFEGPENFKERTLNYSKYSKQ